MINERYLMERLMKIEKLRETIKEIAEKVQQTLASTDLYKESEIIADVGMGDRDDMALFYVRGQNHAKIGQKIVVVPQIGLSNFTTAVSNDFLPEDGSFSVFGYHLIKVDRGALSGHKWRAKIYKENEGKIVLPNYMNDTLGEADINAIYPLIEPDLWETHIMQPGQDLTECVELITNRLQATCVQATMCYQI